MMMVEGNDGCDCGVTSFTSKASSPSLCGARLPEPGTATGRHRQGKCDPIYPLRRPKTASRRRGKLRPLPARYHSRGCSVDAHCQVNMVSSSVRPAQVPRNEVIINTRLHLYLSLRLGEWSIRRDRVSPDLPIQVAAG